MHQLITTSSMDTRIREMVSERPVAIFCKSSCCISHTIKTLFSEIGANPTVYELDEIPNGREIEQALPRMGQTEKPTVPAVFIGGDFVGGATEIMSLHVNGSLRPRLKRAGALFI